MTVDARPPKNPFRPSYGSTPPKLAGRDEALTMFEDGLDEGPGAPARSMLVIGQRGMGKTVMLNGVEGLAQQHGWLTISETGYNGLIGRLNNQINGLLHQHDPDAVNTNLSSASLPMGLGSLSWTTEEQYARMGGTRGHLNRLLDVTAENGTGVLITVDEVHAASQDELRELTTLVQHGIRENRDVAFAAAGLPAAVSEKLLDDPVLTFLRRSERVDVGPVTALDVREALQEPIVDAGRAIGEDALEAATNATGGYPFLIQLVGYHTWRQHPHEHRITIDDVKSAMPSVADRLGRQVIEPALQPLSETDRKFLSAMAVDNGPSAMSDIADRLEVDGNYANQYRARLLEAELIVPARHGQVTFTLPGLRHHLRTVDLDPEIESGIDI